MRDIVPLVNSQEVDGNMMRRGPTLTELGLSNEINGFSARICIHMIAMVHLSEEYLTRKDYWFWAEESF